MREPVFFHERNQDGAKSGWYVVLEQDAEPDGPHESRSAAYIELLFSRLCRLAPHDRVKVVRGLCERFNVVYP